MKEIALSFGAGRQEEVGFYSEGKTIVTCWALDSEIFTPAAGLIQPPVMVGTILIVGRRKRNS